MKIFYAVQATGNGHISRAMELLPYLQQVAEVDIFLSGANSTLDLDGPVRYRSKGLSLFYKCDGGLDHWKMARSIAPLRLRREIADLPVDKYDLVINDFDYITAAACARKKVRSVQFGHQASFHSSHTPRPARKSAVGEWILQHYAKADHYIGLHFDAYDDFIFTPVVKKKVLDADPTNKGHLSVYLPGYCEPQLRDAFAPLCDHRFDIFSRETTRKRTEGNITFLPVSRDGFTESMTHCRGVITGGGFETPAEAIHLGKQLMVMPLRGQYEQQCNAAALEQMSVCRLEKLDENFPALFHHWLTEFSPVQRDYAKSVEQSLDYLFALQEQQWHPNPEASSEPAADPWKI